MNVCCVADNIVVGIILVGCLIAVTASLIYGTVLVRIMLYLLWLVSMFYMQL